MTLLVVLPLVAITTWFVLFIWNVRAKHIPGIKGPRQWPLIGNAIEMNRNERRLNQWIRECVKKYGKTFHVAIPATPPYIMTADPENVKYILQTNFENFPKGTPWMDRMTDLLGHGIFNADGANWKTHRKTASAIFSMAALRDEMSPVFLEHGKKLLSRLEKVAGKPGKHVDLQDLFFKYTLDSIALIAFGVDLHCLDQDQVPFAAAFDYAQRIIDKRFLSPEWRVMKLLQIGSEGIMTKQIKIVEEFADRVVNERKTMSKEKLTRKTDLLSKYIAMGKDSSGRAFTNKDLSDIVLNMIIAGRDTTAQNLSWLFYELALHPEEEQKAFEEVRAILGKDGWPSYDIVTTQTPYLHACLVEALRLHPSVPKELKHALNDDTLPDGTKVPAGAGVLPLIQALMRETDVWGEDAEEFRPQRWIEFEQEPDAFKFPAFQAGPRTCLGKHMALCEGKMAAAMLLNKFRCNLVPGQRIEEEIALTLPARYGILMTVEYRDHAEESSNTASNSKIKTTETHPAAVAAH